MSELVPVDVYLLAPMVIVVNPPLSRWVASADCTHTQTDKNTAR